MKLKILFLVFFAFQTLKAQTVKEIDSLIAIIKTTKNDSVKVSVLNKLALNFISSDVNKAKSYQKQSEELAISKKNKYGYNESVFIKGGIYVLTGLSDSAYVYYKKAYDLSLKNKYKPIEVRCLNGFGMIDWNKGNLDDALSFFFKALKLNESLPQSQQINSSLFYNNIGLIYIEKRLYDKGLFYTQKAYDLRVKGNLLKDQGASLNNLGICFMNLNKTDLAIDAFEKGKIITKETNNTLMYYKIIHNLANLYADNKNYDKAIVLYLEVLNKPNSNTNPRDLIILYGCISNTYSKINLFNESLKYANSGLDVIKAHPEIEKYADNIYNALAKANFHSGNIEKGDYYLTKHYNNIKNLFSEESKTALAEMEVKYNLEKQEMLLIQSEAAIEKSKLELKNEKTQFIFMAILALGLLVITYLLYHQQKLKNNQQKQEFELESTLVKIEAQSKLQEQRLEISRDLHDNIGSQLTFIISSVDNIKYAFQIQNSKLEEKLNNISNFAKSTIIELRDTIWAMNKNAISFEDLKSRIALYIDNAKIAAQGIEFNFKIHGNFNNTVFSTTEGMNIFRIIQESINNALKHAQANQILVDVFKQNDTFQIQINDNGKGFNTDMPNSGNGLSNLKKRANELSGELVITSKENLGTKVSLFFKK
ncbi:MAG: tetratricopeptide repeat protein [Flavobacteriaceae bacterium]|nr:tetratricopeptide repeat protein [Flavobacteriaceae bacterium]